ncbi:DNA (cytosine-5)-methyltransferase 1A-like [Rhododendron vialii]|uniref:DNA (cytosine-5)-methyltransferase 1A-like n=1 Tax=Rhododendron vialii TaxID=182163 RepID=UPI00265FC989|nr:DNA (cytosine-5)-methyltransferase 1A-like [Rhododendron vialii]
MTLIYLVLAVSLGSLLHKWLVNRSHEYLRAIMTVCEDETLYHDSMHVFAGPELRVTLNENTQYAAVQSTSNGALFCAKTVCDTIGELPEEMERPAKKRC